MSILTQPNGDNATLPEYTASMLDCSGDVLCSDSVELSPGLEQATAANEREHNAASFVLDTDTMETPSENSENRTDVFSTGKHLTTKESRLENSRHSNSVEVGTVDATDAETFRDAYDSMDTERAPLISLSNEQGSSQEGESEREFSAISQGGGCGEAKEQLEVEGEWLSGTRSPSSLMAYSKASSGQSSVWSDEDVSNGVCSPEYELMGNSGDESSEANNHYSSPRGTLLPSDLHVMETYPSLEQCKLNSHATGMEQTSNNVYARSASVSDEENSMLNIQQQLSSVQLSPTSPLSSITTPGILPTTSPTQPTEQTDGNISTVSNSQRISVMHGVNPSHFPVIDIQNNTSDDDVEQREEENKNEEVKLEKREEEELGEKKEEANVAENKERGSKNVNEGGGGTGWCDRKGTLNRGGGGGGRGGGGGGGGELRGDKVLDHSQNKCDSAAGENGHGSGGGNDGDGGSGGYVGNSGGYGGDGGDVGNSGGDVGNSSGDGGDDGGGRRGGECLGEDTRENSELPTQIKSLTSPTHADPSTAIPEVYTEPPTPLIQPSDKSVSRIENTPPPSPLQGENASQETAVLPTIGVSTDTGAPILSNQPWVSTLNDDFTMDLLLESNLDTSNLDSGVRVPSSDLPVLQPLSPNPDLNEQYEYLRRTLSHSRRRYSTRRRRGHGGTHSPVHRGNRAERRAQQHAVGHRRDMLHSDETSRVDTHVDQHGRTYYMDHRTHTMAFEQGRGMGVDMHTRREMLDRRYRSLQRSFRGHRHVRNTTSLTAIAASPSTPEDLSISFHSSERASLSSQQAQAKNAQSKRKLSNRWFVFGKRSSKKVYQTPGTSAGDDDILPVSPSSVGDEVLYDDILSVGTNDRELEDVSGLTMGSRDRRNGSGEGRSGSRERMSGRGEGRSRREERSGSGERSEIQGRRERRIGSRERRSGSGEVMERSGEGRERRSGSGEVMERSGSGEGRERRSGSGEVMERSGSGEGRERRSGSEVRRERRSGSEEERERRSGIGEGRERRTIKNREWMGQSGEMSAGSRSRERGERGEERERRSRSLGSDDMLTGNLIEGSEETGQGESTAADPVLSSVEREYRQEGMVERRTVEEERTEEEGEEERTRVAGGEDTFAESSSGLNRRWETSIMTAGDQSHSNRTAAKRTSHRVRATTVTSRRLTQSKPVGADYRNHGDTDEETNEAIVVTKGSPEMSPQPETNIEKMEQPENTTHVSSGDFQAPALQFITRKDLYSFLNGTGEVGEAFFANRALMELVQRIRSNITLFTKYQHSRQLVNALNQFADLNAELPEGWEKKLNREGKMFFIDHEHCLTTFMDPRLPLPNQPFTYTQPNPLPLSLNQSVQFAGEAPIRSHHTTVFSIEHIPSPSNTPTVSITAPQPPNQPVEMTYEMQVVSFFRKPNIFEIIAQRYERGFRPQLREIIEDVRLNGTEALERIQSSGSVAAYELALVLSLFEEEISSIRIMAVVELPAPREERYTGGPLTASTLQRKKDAFSTKLQNFKVMMSRLGFAQSSRLKFNLRRDHLLEDSYEHVMKSDVRYLQRKKLNICFKGEEGLDYGGPSREFFFLLSREIFNPYYGLFEYSANDTYTVQISPTSVFIQNSLDWFRFAGRVIGLVVVQGFLLDVFFTRTVYKVLMNRNPSLKDLESLEPAFYSSLLWIRDNDPEPLDLTFTVEEEAFGQLSTHELKEGGTDIPVTDDNKNEYIDLMLRWRLDRGITEPMEMLKKGFNEVMPISLLQTFDAQELEFLTAGTLEIDVADWKMHTEYRNGYHPNHPVILWFWQVVEMFDNEQRLRLLQFVTGTSSVPFEGFKALRGSNGPKRFAIDFFNDVNSLPRTHTCFNRIDLPPYPSLTILFHKLQIAIEEGNTFGIE